MKFEWDEKKNQVNYRKHRVRFEEACYVFSDVYALNKFDDDHSDYEDRWIMLGKSPLSNKILALFILTKKLRETKLLELYLQGNLLKKNSKHI